jgi:tRNA splicing ligase
MNGRIAKEIKRQIYGDYSPKFRKYKVNTKTNQIIADPKRQEYQQAKKQYNEKKGV